LTAKVQSTSFASAWLRFLAIVELFYLSVLQNFYVLKVSWSLKNKTVFKIHIKEVHQVWQ
jgi:hypothetical protein